MNNVIDAYNKMQSCKEAFTLTRNNMLMQIDEDRKKMIKSFLPLIEEAYTRWTPEIGEEMMLVDFYENGCFVVTLHKLCGNLGSAKENDGNYWNFYLKSEIEDQYTAVFILPMFFYEEIKDKFKFERWDLND